MSNPFHSMLRIRTFMRNLLRHALYPGPSVVPTVTEKPDPWGVIGPGGRLSSFSAPTQPLKSRICALATQSLDGMRPDSHNPRRKSVFGRGTFQPKKLGVATFWRRAPPLHTLKETLLVLTIFWFLREIDKSLYVLRVAQTWF